MKIKNLFIRGLVLLAVLFAPLYGVSAQEPEESGDVFRIGENYVLSEGETHNGSIIIIGGNVTIEEDANVDGDIVVIGGNIETLGQVDGELIVIGGNISVSDKVGRSIVAIGGQIELTETAVVGGDVTIVGGQLNKDPKAQIDGTVTNNAPVTGIPNPPSPPDVPDVPGVPNPPSVPDFDYPYNPLWNVMTTLFNAAAVAAIAMLLSLFFQPQFERVADTIVKQPFMAGSFGLLSIVVGVIAIVIMSITVILIPIAILAVFLFPLAWLFGTIALGHEVGERFTRAINQTWATPLTVGFGTLLLMMVSGLFELVPCVGEAVPALIALIGIGGVAMTWFGTRSAPNQTAQVVEVPPAS